MLTLCHTRAILMEKLAEHETTQRTIITTSSIYLRDQIVIGIGIGSSRLGMASHPRSVAETAYHSSSLAAELLNLVRLLR